MTGPELRAIRLKLGLTPTQFGRAMGYSGKGNITIHHMELPEGDRNKKTITLQAERLARMFEWHKVPPEWSQP
jgi:hypothetical protein